MGPRPSRGCGNHRRAFSGPGSRDDSVEVCGACRCPVPAACTSGSDRLAPGRYAACPVRDRSAAPQSARNLIGDPAEVVHFLGRTARALERLRDTPVAVPTSSPASPRTSALTSPTRALSAREQAEAVFSGAPAPTSGTAPAPTSLPTPSEAMFRKGNGALPRPRIVMDRKGRGVRVEVRRAREAGQMEMFGQP